MEKNLNGVNYPKKTIQACLVQDVSNLVENMNNLVGNLETTSVCVRALTIALLEHASLRAKMTMWHVIHH